MQQNAKSRVSTIDIIIEEDKRIIEETLKNEKKYSESNIEVYNISYGNADTKATNYEFNYSKK